MDDEEEVGNTTGAVFADEKREATKKIFTFTAAPLPSFREEKEERRDYQTC